MSWGAKRAPGPPIFVPFVVVVPPPLSPTHLAAAGGLGAGAPVGRAQGTGSWVWGQRGEGMARSQVLQGGDTGVRGVPRYPPSGWGHPREPPPQSREVLSVSLGAVALSVPHLGGVLYLLAPLSMSPGGCDTLGDPGTFFWGV